LRVSKYARPVGESSFARSSGSGSVAMMYEPIGMIRRRSEGAAPSV
jgi:hypothetical protein